MKSALLLAFVAATSFAGPQKMDKSVSGYPAGTHVESVFDARQRLYLYSGGD